MSSTKIKTCRNCNRRKSLYEKYCCTYALCRYYYCALHDKTVNLDGSCEDWTKARDEYDLSKKRFDEAEEDVKIILEHLKDM